MQSHLGGMGKRSDLGSISPVDLLSAMMIRYGVCVPSSCTDDDVTESLTIWLNTALQGLQAFKPFQTNKTFVALPLNCHTADEKVDLDSGDWGMISILLMFLILIVCGTLVDIVFTQFKPSFLPGVIVQIFQGFSVYHNTKKIFNTKSGSDNLSCINGIRFLSMSWVLIGHTFMMHQPQPFIPSVFINNLLILADQEGPLSKPAIAVIWNAFSSVDSFFLIGAVLLSYLTLKQLDKEDGGSPRMWFMFYIHRYLRLSGVYAIIIGLNATLLKYLYIGPAAGPGSSGLALDTETCGKWWWWNLLYINNFGEYIDKDDPFAPHGCMGHTWYMANDMQFFILSPLIIYPFWYFSKKGNKLAWLGHVQSLVWLIIATIIPLIMTIQDDISFGGGGEFSDFYNKPWNRFQPYVIGLYLGFLLHKYKSVKNPKIPLLVVLVGWMVATALGASVVYGIARYHPVSVLQPSIAERAAYNCLARISWSLALSWVIVACVKGFGGVINQFLSWAVFIPLARLSYTIYLVHLGVISYINSQASYSVSYSNLEATYQALGNLLLCIAVAYVVVISFEAPILHMEKLLWVSLGITKLSPLPPKITEKSEKVGDSVPTSSPSGTTEDEKMKYPDGRDTSTYNAITVEDGVQKT